MAKFCTHCGTEVSDDAVICVNCGCAIEQKPAAPAAAPAGKIQVSVILGIVGIIFAWLLAIIGHITSIIGIVFGIKEYKQTNKMLGLILSIVGEVFAILSSIIGAVALSGVA